jgi:hypothetical protein
MANELKDGYSALVTRLGQITGLPVVSSSDPRNINPPCVLVDAPSFLMHTNVVTEMQFSIKILAIGPGDRKALDKLLDLADLIRAAEIGLMSGRPTVTQIGNQDFASYELTLSTKVAP